MNGRRLLFCLLTLCFPFVQISAQCPKISAQPCISEFRLWGPSRHFLELYIPEGLDLSEFRIRLKSSKFNLVLRVPNSQSTNYVVYNISEDVALPEAATVLIVPEDDLDNILDGVSYSFSKESTQNEFTFPHVQIKNLHLSVSRCGYSHVQTIPTLGKENTCTNHIRVLSRRAISKRSAVGRRALPAVNGKTTRTIPSHPSSTTRRKSMSPSHPNTNTSHPTKRHTAKPATSHKARLTTKTTHKSSPKPTTKPTTHSSKTTARTTSTSSTTMTSTTTSRTPTTGKTTRISTKRTKKTTHKTTRPTTQTTQRSSKATIKHTSKSTGTTGKPTHSGISSTTVKHTPRSTSTAGKHTPSNSPSTTVKHTPRSVSTTGKHIPSSSSTTVKHTPRSVSTTGKHTPSNSPSTTVKHTPRSVSTTGKHTPSNSPSTTVKHTPRSVSTTGKHIPSSSSTTVKHTPISTSTTDKHTLSNSPSTTVKHTPRSTSAKGSRTTTKRSSKGTSATRKHSPTSTSSGSTVTHTIKSHSTTGKTSRTTHSSSTTVSSTASSSPKTMTHIHSHTTGKTSHTSNSPKPSSTSTSRTTHSSKPSRSVKPSLSTSGPTRSSKQSSTHIQTSVTTSKPAILTPVINEVSLLLQADRNRSFVELKGFHHMTLENYSLVLFSGKATLFHKRFVARDTLDGSGFRVLQNIQIPANTTNIAVALYNNSKWLMHFTKNVPMSRAMGLLDSFVMRTTTASLDPVLLKSLLPKHPDRVFSIRPSVLGNNSTFSISRCGDDTEDPGDFILAPMTKGRPNNCTTSYGNRIQFKLTNANCTDFDDKNPKRREELVDLVVDKVNSKCMCGFSRYLVKDKRYYCGSLIFEAHILASSKLQSQLIVSHYRDFVNASKVMVIGSQRYETDPTCWQNCFVPTTTTPSLTHSASPQGTGNNTSSKPSGSIEPSRSTHKPSSKHSQAPATAQTPVILTPVINEVNLLIEGDRNQSFVELKGLHHMTLENYSLVLFSGKTTLFHKRFGTRDTLDGSGFLVLQNIQVPANTENIAVALYNNSKWLIPFNKHVPIAHAMGLVDSFIVKTTSAKIDPDVLENLLPKHSDRVFTIKPSVLRSNSSISISRCGNDTEDPGDFILTPMTKGRPNNCTTTYGNRVQFKLTNAKCTDFDDNNPKRRQELVDMIVYKVNLNCMCGFSQQLVKDRRYYCGSLIFEARLVATTQLQSQLIFNHYRDFVKTSTDIVVGKRSYNTDSTCWQNCPMPTAKTLQNPTNNTTMTVAIVLASVGVFLIIAIGVIIYMRRKKRGVVTFRLTTLGETDTSGMLHEDRDDIIDDTATFRTIALSQ